MQQQVRDFHEKFGADVLETPSMWNTKLRAKLIAEEFSETMRAMGYAVDVDIDRVDHERDFAHAIDGLCDLLYVIFGTAVTWGIDLEPFFDLVHKANMAKVGGGKRADGKILKPAGWQPPDIEGELDRQELGSFGGEALGAWLEIGGEG